MIGQHRITTFLSLSKYHLIHCLFIYFNSIFLATLSHSMKRNVKKHSQLASGYNEWKRWENLCKAAGQPAFIHKNSKKQERIT